MAKIILEREKCIGCGSCQTVCPKYWRLDKEGKAEYLGPAELAEIDCNKEAAEVCPVQCILIKQ